MRATSLVVCPESLCDCTQVSQDSHCGAVSQGFELPSRFSCCKQLLHTARVLENQVGRLLKPIAGEETQLQKRNSEPRRKDTDVSILTPAMTSDPLKGSKKDEGSGMEGEKRKKKQKSRKGRTMQHSGLLGPRACDPDLKSNGFQARSTNFAVLSNSGRKRRTHGNVESSRPPDASCKFFFSSNCTCAARTEGWGHTMFPLGWQPFNAAKIVVTAF